MRKTARLKIEYQYVLDENKNLTQMLDMCTRTGEKDSIAIDGLKFQLEKKDDQIKNRNLVITQWEAKYLLADEQKGKESGRKKLFFITTIVSTSLLLITLLK